MDFKVPTGRLNSGYDAVMVYRKIMPVYKNKKEIG